MNESALSRPTESEPPLRARTSSHQSARTEPPRSPNLPLSPRVSEAWRNEIFNSPGRIDVQKNGKSTTRHPVAVGCAGTVSYANGAHERIAGLLLEHLWVEGYVRRWKYQPLDLGELDGPAAVPDILVESYTRQLHIIEVKAKRFITPEIECRFAAEGDFLNALGFRFHVWTNHDVLSSDTSHTVAELERGRRFPADAEVIREIQAMAAACTVLGELFERFGWDDVLAAAAQQAFHFDITKPIYEQTPILRNHSVTYYDHLFAQGHAAAGWWDALGRPESR